MSITSLGGFCRRSLERLAVHVRVAVEDDHSGAVGDGGPDPDHRLGGVPF
jgi:hypothetical protein